MSRSDRVSIRPNCFGNYARDMRPDRGCHACKSSMDCIPPQEEMTMAGNAAWMKIPYQFSQEKEALQKPASQDSREYTGGSVEYYRVRISAPVSGGDAYTAECNDIIEALGMNYAEGNAFKAIWRSCAARALGVSKRGYTDGLYDAEKVVFFGGRMVAIRAKELES